MWRFGYTDTDVKGRFIDHRHDERAKDGRSHPCWIHHHRDVDVNDRSSVEYHDIGHNDHRWTHQYHGWIHQDRGVDVNERSSVEYHDIGHNDHGCTYHYHDRTVDDRCTYDDDIGSTIWTGVADFAGVDHRGR